MKDVKIRISADTTQAEKSMKDLSKETKGVKKSVDDTGDSTSALTGKLDAMTGGAVTGLKSMRAGIKSTIVGLKTLRGAVMATGIGALVLIVVSLMQAFKSSEEGQNRWAKAMGMLGAVTSVITDGLAAFGSLIIDVFTKPKKVFEDFSKSIKEFVTDKITKVIEGLGLLGSAIKKAFSGDFKGAFDDASAGVTKLNNGLNPIKMGADAIAKSVKGIVKEMTEEAKIAGRIADMRAKADKIERGLIVERAKANQKRADLLNKAMDKEKFTAAERKAFLIEAGKIDEDITKKEMDAVQLRIDAKKAENALGLSTKEDKEELANLEAKLIDLDTARLSKAKEVTSQIVGLTAEERAEKKRLADESIANQKKIDDFNNNTKEEKRQTEKDALKTQFDELMKLAGDDNEAKLELQKSYDERLLEMKKKHGDEDAAAQKVIDDKKASDDEKAKAKEIAEIQAVADAEDAIQASRLGAIKNGLGLLAQLGEESKAVKAAALIGESAVGIAEMSISKGKADGLANIQVASPNPLMQANGLKALAMNKINLGLGIASNIAATAKGLSALGAGGAPSGGAGGAGGAQAPSFNLVEGTESNAIQNTINGAGSKPVKAYVTSGDITTAQQADRQAELNSGF